MRYAWLLLDVDNTLFDYDKAEALALERTFEAAGHSFKAEYVELYRSINSRMWRDFELGLTTANRIKVQRFVQLQEAIGVDHDPKDLSQAYLEHLASIPDLLAGAEETVRALSGHVGMVLVTNGLQAVQRSRIARSAIRDCFADVVISEEVGFSKPNAEIFDIAFQRMNQPDKADVLMVGDSLTSDIQGGVNYGIDTCWYNPGRRSRPAGLNVRYEIEQLSELLDIVGAT